MAANAMVRQLLLSPTAQKLDDATIGELTCQADLDTLRALPLSVRISGITAHRLAQRGYEFAIVAGTHTDDQSALDRLARSTSIQVRRAVATNPSIASETAKTLWHWAIGRTEVDTVANLAPHMPLETQVSDWILPQMRVKSRRSTVLLSSHLTEGVTHLEMLRCAKELSDDSDGAAISQLAQELVYDLCSTGGDISTQLVEILEEVDDPTPLVSQIAQYGPVSDIIDVRIAPEAFDGYVTDDRVVDPSTVIRLLKTAPERLELSVTIRLRSTPSAIQSSGTQDAVAAFLLANASKFPDRAMQVINGELESLDRVDTALLEAAIRDIPVTYFADPDASLFEIEPLFELPHQLASDVIVKAIQHRGQLSYYLEDPLITWMIGEYEHQQPLPSEIAALFAEPVDAFRQQAYYGTNPNDVVTFITRHLLGRYRTQTASKFGDFAEAIFDALGSDWGRVVKASSEAAAYAAAQVVARTALSAENIRVVLAMLANAQVPFKQVLQSLERLNPPVTTNNEKESVSAGLQMTLV